MRKTSKKGALASAPRRITVFSSPGAHSRGLLCCGALRLACALGRTGVTHMKREGDGATPAGRYRLISLIVRRDRLPGPRAAVPMRPMRRDDGWCEDPRHGSYNCSIRLPSSAGHDAMWRQDRLYDIVGILDWNLRPRIRGLGSAIFLHLCRPGLSPTAGCVALRGADLMRLLAVAGPSPEFVVAGKPRRHRKGRPHAATT